MLVLTGDHELKTGPERTHGFTLTELLVVIAVITLAAFVVAPLIRPTPPALRLRCANNLKQIGLAFRTWALDNQDLFPQHAVESTNAPPNLPDLRRSPPAAVYMYQIFCVMSNELTTARLLVCPADDSPIHANFLMVPNGTANHAVAGQTTLCNLNLSYFVGRDASEENPNAVLAGDRNLYGGGMIPHNRYDFTQNGGYGNSPIHAGAAFSPGFACDLGTNAAAWDADADRSPCWAEKMHHQQGNILLADGSVQEVSNSRLRKQLRDGIASERARTNANVNGNWLLFP